MDLSGVLSVLVTPFTDSGELDLPSLRSLVDLCIVAGSDAVVCFGLAGELYKLTDGDRVQLLSTVVDQAAGRVPVIAGTEHSGFEAAARRTSEAAELGAAAAMLYPPTFVKPDAAGVRDYYATVAASSPVPLIIQDAPAWTGVDLSLDTLEAIHSMVPGTSVKVEAPPSAPKIRALKAIGVPCIAGLGAVHLPEDFDAGASACMPGCGMPKVYVELWRQLAEGTDLGLRAHRRLLPLLSFQMASLDTFVAVQKELLFRSGVITSPRLRRPGRGLDAGQVRWLDRLLALVSATDQSDLLP